MIKYYNLTVKSTRKSWAERLLMKVNGHLTYRSTKESKRCSSAY